VVSRGVESDVELRGRNRSPDGLDDYRRNHAGGRSGGHGAGWDRDSQSPDTHRVGHGRHQQAIAHATANATNLVYSVLAKAPASGTAAGLRLTVQRGTTQWLTNVSNTSTLTSEWRRYYVTIPDVRGASNVTVGVYLDGTSSTLTEGAALVAFPHLKWGDIRRQPSCPATRR
jgi:hypothetical protein